MSPFCRLRGGHGFNGTSGIKEAGKLLLRTEPIIFNDHTLQLSNEGRQDSSVPPPKTGGMFVPRKAGPSRPKVGLGFTRTSAKAGSSSAGTGGESRGTKGQDDFRSMLGGK